MDLSKQQGGYGLERYEKREMQQKVRTTFDELQILDDDKHRILWYVVDASLGIEEVQNKIRDIAQQIIQDVENGKPLYKMWEEGEYTEWCVDY